MTMKNKYIMNENLNLVKLLKDCPKGTKFYSIIYGDVYFEYIESSTPYPYPVILKSSSGEKIAVTSKGQHYFYYNGECTLFPSKDQRDWSKWQRPFKDGDIIFTRTQYIWVSIFKRYNNEKCETYMDLNIEKNRLFNDTPSLCSISEIEEQRLATEEEKQFLFKALKERRYKWNQETKTLERLIVPKFKVGDRVRHKTTNKDDIYEISKVYDNSYGLVDFTWMIYMKYQDQYELVPNRFDPNTLIPFESKVLVRDGDQYSWVGSIYTHHKENGFYTVNGTYYCQCIPYNDDTAHLIGTYKEAPKYYKYWEK